MLPRGVYSGTRFLEQILDYIRKQYQSTAYGHACGLKRASVIEIWQRHREITQAQGHLPADRRKPFTWWKREEKQLL